jgi:uncharacterized repeat protein (TIGR03803 family)
VLYSFSNAWNSPHSPYGGVIMGPDGSLYGTTYADWCWECGEDSTSETGGTVFRLAPPTTSGGNWTQHELQSFYPFTPMGVKPYGGVIFHGGSLYGMTSYTTPIDSCGAVYELSPPATAGDAWTGTAIYGFGDGCNPWAPLTNGPDGVIYGSTSFGGSNGGCPNAGLGGCGLVFQLTPPTAQGGTWTQSVLYDFTGTNGDGSLPSPAGFVVGPDGTIYGTTTCGGTGPTARFPCSYNAVGGSGTVFALSSPTTPGGMWTETILHSFTGGADGAVPMVGLIPGPDGVLYGTTSNGGISGNGVVFSIKP